MDNYLEQEYLDQSKQASRALIDGWEQIGERQDALNVTNSSTRQRNPNLAIRSHAGESEKCEGQKVRYRKQKVYATSNTEGTGTVNTRMRQIKDC